MDNKEIEQRIRDATGAEEVILSGEGCNLDAVVVSPRFEGMSPLERQRMVYAAVDDLLRSGALHALSLRTYTSEQWAEQQAR